MPEIAVLDYRLLLDAQEQIQALASNHILFPAERCPQNEQVARTGAASIALVSPWEKIDVAYLDGCPNLRYISLCGTSTANVDLEELAKRGIAFSNIVSHDKEAVAEFVFMQLVSLVRGTENCQWIVGEAHELVGRSIGIIGLGAVGQAIAHLAIAYKMNVLYSSQHRKPEWEDRGLHYLDKANLLESSEIIVLCTPTNVQVMDAEDFTALPPGRILVQACAGTPFDTVAFTQWIDQPENFAIFDMSAGERNYQAYVNLHGVIFSKIPAGDTYESNARRGRRVVENLEEYCRGNPPTS